MGEPLVSVIVPTCNSERFVRQALDSVLMQEGPGFEVIVVDDASTDSTIDILRGYGDRIRVLRRSVNSGTADIPRYDGVEAAKGRYCALLDSDDLWLPGKLRKQVEFMEVHEGIPLSHTYVRVVNEQGEPLHVRHEGAIPGTGRIAQELLRHCFISTSSVLVRRKAWLDAQGREDLTGYGTEWDFFLSIARDHEIGFIPEILSHYRIVSSSVSRKRWRRMPRDVGAKGRILRKGLWKGVISRREMIDIVVEACHENTEYWRVAARPGRGMWFALQALRHRPFASVPLVDLVKCGLDRFAGKREP